MLRNPVALAVLLGTVTSLAPIFALTSYLPPLLGTAGAAIVVASLAIGAGLVVGTTVVPKLVQARGPRLVLISGTALTLITAVALLALRQTPPAALITLALLGFAGGIVVVPQQARLFTLIPDLAPIAVGLNGSAISIASALGAGITGIALQAGGPSAIPVSAGLLAMIGLAVAAFVRPDPPAQRRKRQKLVSETDYRFPDTRSPTRVSRLSSATSPERDRDPDSGSRLCDVDNGQGL